MKKWLLILLAVLIILVSCIYIFIPSSITVAESVPVTATQQGTLRMFGSRQSWKMIWPGDFTMTYRTDSLEGNHDTSFAYTSLGFHFYIKKLLYNAIEFTIERNEDSIKSTLYTLPYQVDSLKLQWTALFPSTNNPIKRLQNYITAKRLTRTFQFVLNRMGSNLSKVETIYGIGIKKAKIPIQQVITTRRYLDKYPSTETIYEMIDELKKFADQQGVKQIDQPIFNVWSTEEAEFTTQVGLSIDKNIPGNDQYSSKWMMKGGNILTADITGDNKKIEWAKSQMDQYIADNHRSVIAAPFEMFITDRRAEPDSTKWITRLYYPVI
jgi:effector-binding domain-containing protein